MGRVSLKNIMGAIVAATALGACSLLPDGPLFDEEKAAAAAAAKLPPKVPVQRIRNLELGRLFNGYMLTAFAEAPGIGYYQPELKIRYNGEQASDGFFEFDFLVRPPGTDVAETGSEAARAVRADFELTPEMLRRAAGVRIWSESDSVEGRF